MEEFANETDFILLQHSNLIKPLCGVLTYIEIVFSLPSWILCMKRKQKLAKTGAYSAHMPQIS